MTTSELKVLQRFWESKLQYDRFLLEPATLYMIEATVRAIKELVRLNEREAVK